MLQAQRGFESLLDKQTSPVPENAQRHTGAVHVEVAQSKAEAIWGKESELLSHCGTLTYMVN